KMQNPRILRYLIENSEDEEIKRLASEKLKFTPLTQTEKDLYQSVVNYQSMPGTGGFTQASLHEANEKLREGGTYSVHNPDFLTGANISVCLTKELMEAIENDDMYDLRFPDVENYTKEEMKDYNEDWQSVGDVRKWEEMSYGVRVYSRISAIKLWHLIILIVVYYLI